MSEVAQLSEKALISLWDNFDIQPGMSVNEIKAAFMKHRNSGHGAPDIPLIEVRSGDCIFIDNKRYTPTQMKALLEIPFSAIELSKSGRSIAEISADIKVHAQNMARSYIAIGRDLTEAKALLGHGRFLPWLKEMGFGVSAANKYMQLAAEIQDDSPLAELPYSKAFALIQLPAGEREAFARENGVDSKSAAEIKRLIKERDEAQRQAEDNRCGRAQAEYEAEVLRQKLKAKQERPAIIQQVVEVPDDYQALKSAAARHRAEIEEAAQAAEEAESRAAAAEAELARLRREQSGQGADKFTAFQGAANTFLMTVQLLPYDQEEMGSMHNRQRYASLVKGIREWCDEMAVALDDGALSTEGAVV